MPIRIVVVDDHPALIRGVKSLFEGDRFEVVGTAESAAGLSDLVEAKRPDIAITDLSMPGNIFDAIATAVQNSTRVVVFTAFADPQLAFQALEAGALGFVLKGRPADDLFAAIRAVQTDQVFVSPELAPRILNVLRTHNTSEGGERGQRLSAREQQIVDGLLRAKTNKEIARDLNLSEKTIKHYMTNLMTKLGAKNRLDVVLAVQASTPRGAEPSEAIQNPHKGA